MLRVIAWKRGFMYLSIVVGVVSFFTMMRTHVWTSQIKVAVGTLNTHDTPELTQEKETSNLKTIVLWNKFWKSETFGLPELGRAPFASKQCKYNNCFLTRDKNLLPSASAVMIHLAGVKHQGGDLPLVRPPGQLYIQYVLESPANRGYFDFRGIDDTINITMTYRRDSDIFNPVTHTEILDHPKTGKYISRFDMSNRTKSVAGMISRCETNIRREDYLRNLSSYIDIHIIGKCGKGVCPKHDMSKCMRGIATKYKFLIAFENSFCADYITEKPRHAMDFDLVPIVFGGTNYTRDLPPHSYINVLDFKSPRHLADYLKYLSENMTAYMKYFQWRQTHRIGRPRGNSYCKLCEILNDDSYHRTYPHFVEWWTKNQCNFDPMLNITKASPMHQTLPVGIYQKHRKKTESNLLIGQ